MANEIAAGTRLCRSCGAVKPLDDFYRNRTPRPGHLGGGIWLRCRSCVAIERQERREYINNWQRQRRQRLKAVVIAAYGGLCQCCGEAEPAFLTVDHIAQDGKAHRLVVPPSEFYRWLERNGFPKDNFRLLCFNCNCARRFFGGRCPHEHGG